MKFNEKVFIWELLYVLSVKILFYLSKRNSKFKCLLDWIYTRNVHCSVWKEKEEITRVRSEFKVSADAALEWLKVVGRAKIEGEKQVLLFRSHRDKRVCECVCLIYILFDSEDVFNVWKLRVSYKLEFRLIIDPSEQTSKNTSRNVII